MDKGALDLWFKKLSTDEKLDFVMRCEFASPDSGASAEEIEAYTYIKSNEATAESRYLREACLDYLEDEDLLEMEYDDNGNIIQSTLTEEGRELLQKGGWLIFAREREEKHSIVTERIEYVDFKEINRRSRNIILKALAIVMLFVALLVYLLVRD